MFSQREKIQKYLTQHQELFGERIYFPKEIVKNTQAHTNTDNSYLSDYYLKIKDCLDCSLGHTRTKFVFGVGNPHAELVFVGEAPGKNEDLQGEPFVGRAGKLLDKILAAISLSREDVYICNVLKCRPPENRNPSSSEIEKCRPYLDNQLQLIKPNAIIALGKVAANTLLENDLALNKMRETTFLYNGVDVIVTYHPAALLRNPNLKRPCWEDFQMIQNTYLTKTNLNG